MHIEAAQGTVVLKLGRGFTAPDVERLCQTVKSLAPLSQLVVDFSEVRELHDVDFVSLTQALGALAEVTVVLRGLTLHQSRVLKYLGLSLSQPRALA